MAKFWILLAVSMAVISATQALKCVVCSDSGACVKKTDTTDCTDPNNVKCMSIETYDADSKMTMAIRSCQPVCAATDTRTDEKGAGVETECCAEDGCNKGGEDGAASVVVSSILLIVSLVTALKFF